MEAWLEKIIGTPAAAGGPRDRQVGLPVRELEHPDWRQQERALEPPAENLDARVAPGDVAQHPRHDPPALEGGAVGAQRFLAAGARGHIRERLGPHHSSAPAARAARVDRHARLAPTGAAEIDRRLAYSSAHLAGQPIGRIG